MNDSKAATTPPPLPIEALERLRSAVYMGKIRGIALYLEASWFLLVAFIIWSLGTAYFPYYLPGKSMLFYFGLSSVATLVFYLSLLLHELGHSVVSQKNGIPVPRITLSFIGGIAEISKEPEDPKTELKVALGGPAVTLVLVLFFYGLGLAGDLMGNVAIGRVAHWLGASNLFLLCFNAIPGYPLDGGRVLRALLWMRSGRLKRATYISSRIGIGVAWMLMASSIFFLLFLHAPLQAFVFFLIGSFLKNAAAQGYEAAVEKETLGVMGIGEIMTRNPITIPSHLPLNLVVDDYFFASHHSAYPVERADGSFAGILRLPHVIKIPKERWPYVTASEALDASNTSDLWIYPAMNATEAIRVMSEKDCGRLAVVEAGHIVGMITRHDIFRCIEVRSELA